MRTTPADPAPACRLGVAGFSVPQLLAAVSLLLILALVVPALVATFVQRRRVERATADVTRIARALDELTAGNLSPLMWSSGTSSGEATPATLVGPGEQPKSPKFPEWLKGRSDALINHLAPGEPLERVEATTALHGRRLDPGVGFDPWGNCYLVNIGAARADDSAGTGRRRARAIWVLSAGSNGVVETPYDQPASRAIVGGDDVAVRVWR